MPLLRAVFSESPCPPSGPTNRGHAAALYHSTPASCIAVSPPQLNEQASREQELCLLQTQYPQSPGAMHALGKNLIIM